MSQLLHYYYCNDKSIINQVVHSQYSKKENFHLNFPALHPYCKLTPAILMTKCYTWKSAVEKGSMKIELNSSNTISGGLKSNSSNEHSNQPKMRPRSSSKDLGKNFKISTLKKKFAA